MKHSFITKDTTSLYNKRELNPRSVLEEIIYGYDGEEFQINPDLPKINKFITADNMFFSDNTSQMNNYIGKNILAKNIFLVKFDRNIRLKYLMQVGEAVDLIFLNKKQDAYTGRYVSNGFSCEFRRERSTLYNCNISIVLFRPNDEEKKE